MPWSGQGDDAGLPARIYEPMKKWILRIAVMALLSSAGSYPSHAATAGREGYPHFSPTDLTEVRAKSVQDLQVKDGDKTDEVYLYAPDLKTQVVGDDEGYCAENPGDTGYSGEFYLVVVRNNRILSALDAGSFELVKPGIPKAEAQPDQPSYLPPDEPPKGFRFGLKTFAVPGRSGSFLQINQYTSCLGDQQIFLFSVDEGVGRRVRFVMQDGKPKDSMMNLELSKDDKSIMSIYNSYSGRGGDGNTYFHYFRGSKDRADHDLHEVSSCIEPPDKEDALCPR